MSALLDTAGYTRALFGANAVHVPAWLYVQNTGSGFVSFVGGSKAPTGSHPLRYGSGRTHQLIVGELIVRPHLVVATDSLRGLGIAGLALGDQHERVLAEGEWLVGGPR